MANAKPVNAPQESSQEAKPEVPEVVPEKKVTKLQDGTVREDH